MNTVTPFATTMASAATAARVIVRKVGAVISVLLPVVQARMWIAPVMECATLPATSAIVSLVGQAVTAPSQTAQANQTALTGDSAMPPFSPRSARIVPKAGWGLIAMRRVFMVTRFPWIVASACVTLAGRQKAAMWNALLMVTAASTTPLVSAISYKVGVVKSARFQAVLDLDKIARDMETVTVRLTNAPVTPDGLTWAVISQIVLEIQTASNVDSVMLP